MHAHVFLIADRHAGNNDAVAEDIAARRRIGMDSDLLRAAAIAVRDPERELLALVPFAVIGGADRTLRVLAEIPRVATREALGFRDRDRESERLESALEFLREFEDDVRRTERVPVVVVEPSAAAVLREFGVEPEDLGVDRLVEAELRERASLPPRFLGREVREDDLVGRAVEVDARLADVLRPVLLARRCRSKARSLGNQTSSSNSVAGS